MNCTKCDNNLPYGAKYCNECGEKVPQGAFDAEYNDTIWSKIDKLKDEYDDFFLKKITGSIVFKILTMAVVLVYFLVTLYGNFMGIRLKESDAYAIQYNKKAEEYYICPKNKSSNLELYVPFGTESIVFTGVSGDSKDTQKYTLEQYEEKGYSITAGEYDSVYIETFRKDKIIDRVKFVVVAR